MYIICLLCVLDKWPDAFVFTFSILKSGNVSEVTRSAVYTNIFFCLTRPDVWYPYATDRLSGELCGSRWLIWVWLWSSDGFWILAALRTLFAFIRACWVSPLLAWLPSSLSKVSFMKSIHFLSPCWMLIALMSLEEDDFIWRICITVLWNTFLRISQVVRKLGSEHRVGNDTAPLEQLELKEHCWRSKQGVVWLGFEPPIFW